MKLIYEPDNTLDKTIQIVVSGHELLVIAAAVSKLAESAIAATALDLYNLEPRPGTSVDVAIDARKFLEHIGIEGL